MELVGYQDFRNPKKKLKVENSKDDSLINCVSNYHTLERIAIVSFVEWLWNESDVKCYIKETWKEINTTSYTKLKIGGEKVEEIVLSKLNKVVMPNLLKTKVQCLITPIRIHLFHFLAELSRGQVNIDVYLKKRIPIHFTTEGAVDKIKSLIELLRYETSPKNTEKSSTKSDLYMFACNYCLEEYVSLLWPSLSSKDKSRFKHTYSKSHLVAYWTAVILNELNSLLENILFAGYTDMYDRNLNINQIMVSFCISKNNVFAFQYFWYRLNAEEKNDTTINKWLQCTITNLEKEIWLYPYHNLHTLYSCMHIVNFLFLLSPTQIKQHFETSSDVDNRFLLQCLFHDWSFQKYFSPTVGMILDCLPEYENEYENRVFYETFIYDIATIHSKEGKKEDASLLDMLYLSPHGVKMLCIRYLKPHLLAKLIAISGVETIYMLLEEAPADKKKHIIFGMIGNNAFFDNLASYKWDLVDKILSKMLSKGNMITFKLLSIAKYAEYLHYFVETEPNEEFVNWAFQLQDEFANINETELNHVKSYIALISFNNYDRVQQFLKYCFKTEADICRFKSSLCHEANVETVVKLLCSFSRKNVNVWDRFEKFVNYNFNSPESIIRFKTIFVRHTHSLLDAGVCSEHNFEFCTSFLNWCLGSYAEILRFKNELMISPLLIDQFYNKLLSPVKYGSIKGWKSVREKMKWFSPSKRTVSNLQSDLVMGPTFCDKCNLICETHNKRIIFFALLDSLITEDESAKWESLNFYFDLEDILNEFAPAVAAS